MAARAAFAAGAGLVHAVAPPDTVAALVQAEPDLQTLAHPLRSATRLLSSGFGPEADALAIGPGLGREPGRRELVASLIAVAKAVVLDADALVAFAGRAAELAQLARRAAVGADPASG